jgi:hypothetical protein
LFLGRIHVHTKKKQKEKKKVQRGGERQDKHRELYFFLLIVNTLQACKRFLLLYIEDAEKQENLNMCSYILASR